MDGLASLVDKNMLLLADQPGGEKRFAMLETIREFAQEQLAASGEDELVERRHAEYFLALAEHGELEVIAGPAQVGWLERLECEHDNLRAALRFARRHGMAELGPRLAGALTYFWMVRGIRQRGNGTVEQRAGAQ